MNGATTTIRLRREGLNLGAGFPFVMAEVVVAEKLVKNYDEFRAVDSIGFSIHQGECFGFLGPNGAGKSTTMRMIHCASPLTSGKLLVLDMDVEVDPRGIKALIGVAPQENNLDPDFTVIKNLTSYARYFNMDKALALKRSEELLKFMQLTEKRDVMVTELSGGMKRRLIIARALINEPRILILDEPTTGLDPQARHLIWERIRELKRKGVTVILTTHYMDEAEKLCDRLVIMDKGKIVVEGTPRKLIEERIGAEVVEIDEPGPEVEAFVKERGLDFERTADRLLIYSRCCEDLLGELRTKFQLESVIIRRASLEDVFLRLTGRRLVE
jgi:lipooligosaccharide transport system ATP-binding protein